MRKIKHFVKGFWWQCKSRRVHCTLNNALSVCRNTDWSKTEGRKNKANTEPGLSLQKQAVEQVRVWGGGMCVCVHTHIYILVYEFAYVPQVGTQNFHWLPDTYSHQSPYLMLLNKTFLLPLAIWDQFFPREQQDPFICLSPRGLPQPWALVVSNRDPGRGEKTGKWSEQTWFILTLPLRSRVSLVNLVHQIPTEPAMGQTQLLAPVSSEIKNK